MPTATRASAASPSPVAAVTSTTGSPASASSSSRARVTPPATVLEPAAPAALQHTDGSLGAAAAAAQHDGVGRLARRRRTRVALGGPGRTPGRPAAGTGPVRLRTHTTRPGRRSGPAHEPGENSPARTGSSSAPVGHLDAGPAAPLRRPDARAATERRARRRAPARPAAHGTPGPAGPLDGDVAGVPRRGLLVPACASSCSSRTTMASEGAVGHRAHTATRVPTTERRPPRARAKSGARHVAGDQGARWPARRSRAAMRAAVATAGHHDDGRPGADGAEHERPPVRGRRQPHHRAARCPSEPASSVPGRCRSARWPGRQTVGRRRCRRTEAGGRPSATPPTGQLDQLGRRPRPTALGERSARSRTGGPTPSSTTQPPTRRPCRSMRTSVADAPGPGGRPGPGSRRSVSMPAGTSGRTSRRSGD